MFASLRASRPVSNVRYLYLAYTFYFGRFCGDKVYMLAAPPTLSEAHVNDSAQARYTRQSSVYIPTKRQRVKMKSSGSASADIGASSRALDYRYMSMWRWVARTCL